MSPIVRERSLSHDEGDAAAGAARRREAREARLVTGGLLVAFAANVGWRLWLVRGFAWPVVRMDEDGYLIAARALTGGPGGLTSDNTMFHRVGYSLLIAPVYLFTHDPGQVYRGVQLVNAVINSLALVLVYLCARRIFGLSRGWAFVTAVAAGLLPTVVFYSEFALTDAVLATLALGWVLALHATFAATGTAARIGSAVASGTCAGLIWLVHIRGTVVVAVHLLVFGVLAAHRRRFLAPALMTTAAVVCCLLVDLLARRHLDSAVRAGGNSPGSTFVSRLTTPNGLLLTLEWSAGQLWYLLVSTLGLAGVGIAAALRSLLLPRDWAAGLTMATMLAVTWGIALLSAASLPAAERVNFYAYPRYLAFLAPLWVVAAVGALAGPSARGRFGLALTAVVLLVGSAAVVRAAIPSNLTAYLAFDAPEVSMLTGSWTRLAVVPATAAATAALAVLATLLSIGRRSGFAALAAVAALSCVAMPKITRVAAESLTRTHTVALTLVAAGVRPGDQVAESTDVPWWVRANHQLEVYWAPLRGFRGVNTRPPAGATVVVAPWSRRSPSLNWHGTAFGWQRVATDAAGSWAIWRRTVGCAGAEHCPPPR